MSVEIIPYVPQSFAESGPLPAVPTSWNGLEKILPDIIQRFGLKTDLALEFGVWHGFSTAAFANNFKQVIGIDTFMGDVMTGTEDKPMIETTRKTLALWPNILLFESAYQQFLPKWSSQNKDVIHPDLIHIDIVHTYEDTLACGRIAVSMAPCVIFHDTESFPDVKHALIDLAEETGMYFYNYPQCMGLGILSHKKLFSTMAFAITSRQWEGSKTCIKSWFQTAADVHHFRIVYNRPLMEAYQTLTDETTEDIIAFIHDDVMIYEKDWDLRVLKEFEDPTVGMVGFGGAIGHGSPTLYTEPFKINNFARRGFMSNMRSAEAHGARFTGERDVAVFDGFALFVRRPILEKWGGWPQGTAVNYWAYDYAISCEVRRQGYRNRFVGVDCEHLGGKSPSIVSENIEAAHRWIYDNYRDVLPYQVSA